MTETRIRLDTKEAADFIGCASSTLKVSRSTGTLLGRTPPPYRKMGRKVVYDFNALCAWVEQFESRHNTSA